MQENHLETCWIPSGCVSVSVYECVVGLFPFVRPHATSQHKNEERTEPWR